MGYYANGSGDITFNSVLSEDDYIAAQDILYDAFDVDGIREWRRTSREPPVTIFSIWNSDKYYQDAVRDALNNVIQFGIQDGVISYIGEDDSVWRFIFDGEKWVEENGHVEYDGALSVGRLKHLFRNYISIDLAAVDREYVVSAMEECGMTRAEIEQLGFSELLSADAGGKE